MTRLTCLAAALALTMSSAAYAATCWAGVFGGAKAACDKPAKPVRKVVRERPAEPAKSRVPAVIDWTPSFLL